MLALSGGCCLENFIMHFNKAKKTSSNNDHCMLGQVFVHSKYSKHHKDTQSVPQMVY